MYLLTTCRNSVQFYPWTRQANTLHNPSVFSCGNSVKILDKVFTGRLMSCRDSWMRRRSFISCSLRNWMMQELLELEKGFCRKDYDLWYSYWLVRCYLIFIQDWRVYQDFLCRRRHSPRPDTESACLLVAGMSLPVHSAAFIHSVHNRTYRKLMQFSQQFRTAAGWCEATVEEGGGGH